MFRKDCTTVIGGLLPVNPFLENSFIKVRADIAYSEKVCAFIDAIPKIGQKQYKEFVDTRLIRCKKLVSDTIAKNNFVTPAKSTAKAHTKKKSVLKESDFNKLKAAPLFRPSLCTEVFKKKNDQQMCHGNKLQLLKIFDSTLSLTSTLKKDALILGFSVNSKFSGCFYHCQNFQQICR